jgi:small subunit ribosomal protein S6
VTENDREYETVFILDPTLDEAREKEEVERVVKWVEDLGGSMDEVERWGRRRLAYEIQRKRDGIFNVLHYHAGASHVKELERRMRLNESIMRVLTVLIDPRQKKAVAEAKAAEAERAAAAEAARIAADDEDGPSAPGEIGTSVEPEESAEAAAPAGGESSS